MNQTTKIILANIAVAGCIAIVVVAKIIWFPTVQDAWFQTNGRQLRTVPNGLVIVRPTHFPHTPTNSVGYANDNGKMRVAGRNVTFLYLMAMAYQYNPSRVSLPVGAPTNNFDFVVTGAQEKLRTVILKKTGYSAQIQTQDTDVLALKVADPDSTALAPSGPDEKQNVNFKQGRLYFTHMKLKGIADGLQGVLKTPVVDETGLSNYYDFSLPWSRNMNPNNLTRDDLDKIVGAWGLQFVPDTASIEMLVVKKGD